MGHNPIRCNTRIRYYENRTIRYRIVQPDRRHGMDMEAGEGEDACETACIK